LDDRAAISLSFLYINNEIFLANDTLAVRYLSRLPSGEISHEVQQVPSMGNPLHTADHSGYNKKNPKSLSFKRLRLTNKKQGKMNTCTGSFKGTEKV
jgi:hypothetical protein